MDPFEGRVAVVTGGGGGIGLAMARAFSARGARLVLADNHEARLAAAVTELEGAGAQVFGQHTDVTDAASVEALADAAFSRFGGAHIVCNNAGIAVLGPLLEATDEDWRITFDINFWGVVNGVRAFAPRMIEQAQGGHVVNTSSMAGLSGMSWLGVYCASKFAVVGLTESLARELRPHGIGVSLLCPMIVSTGIGENSTETLARESRGPTHATSPPASEMKGGTVSPDAVATRVVAAIERNEPYILTHLEQREILQRRAARLDAVFDPRKWGPAA